MSRMVVINVESVNDGTLEELIAELQGILKRVPEGVDHWIEVEDSTETEATALIVGYIREANKEEAQEEREFELKRLVALEDEIRKVKEELGL